MFCDPVADADRSTLSFDQAEQFKRDGFCIVKSLLSLAEISELRAELLAICKGDRGCFHGQELDQRVDAPSDCGHAATEDELALRRYYCIHFPHKLSQTVSDFMSAHGRTNAALVQLIGPNVKAVQSMAFVKSPGMPGQAWHQDEHYLPTSDRSLVASWLALDDATPANGTLEVWPGSHSRGVIYPTRAHGRTDGFYDGQSTAHGHGYTDERAVPLEVAAGDGVFFSGHLLHRSTPNRPDSGQLRRVLTCHYMSCESPLIWPQDGSDNRDVVICAGVDPHAHRGFESRHAPFVRPLPETFVQSRRPIVEVWEAVD